MILHCCYHLYYYSLSLSSFLPSTLYDHYSSSTLSSDDQRTLKTRSMRQVTSGQNEQVTILFASRFLSLTDFQTSTRSTEMEISTGQFLRLSLAEQFCFQLSYWSGVLVPHWTSNFVFGSPIGLAFFRLPLNEQFCI